MTDEEFNIMVIEGYCPHKPKCTFVCDEGLDDYQWMYLLMSD